MFAPPPPRPCSCRATRRQVRWKVGRLRQSDGVPKVWHFDLHQNIHIYTHSICLFSTVVFIYSMYTIYSMYKYIERHLFGVVWHILWDKLSYDSTPWACLMIWCNSEWILAFNWGEIRLLCLASTVECNGRLTNLPLHIDAWKGRWLSKDAQGVQRHGLCRMWLNVEIFQNRWPSQSS